MQPITYSLIINLAVLLVAGALAWKMDNPYILIIAVILQTHAIQRFSKQEEEFEEEPSNAIGFSADIK
jgi:hypothetical protein